MMQIQQLPPIPDLSIALNYEKWRMQCLQTNGVSRRVIADHLISTQTEIGLLRATLILGVEVSNFDIAYQLAGQLMCAEDKVIQLFGWYQTAYLTIQKSFCNDANAPLSAKTTIPTLQTILSQLESSAKRTLLSLELELRVHASLCEAYIIIEDFDLSYLHASKMSLLAPIVGLKTYQYSARSLTGLSLMNLGHLKSAFEIMDQLYKDPDTTPYRSHLAVEMSHTLFFSGNFESALKLAELHRADKTVDYEVHFQSVISWTLLRKPESIQHDLEVNRIHPLTRACQFLGQAFQFPHNSQERLKMFRNARAACFDFSINTNSWRSGYEQIFAGLCSLLAGDYGLVQPNLPSLERLKSFPLWVQILGIAVTLELCICYRQLQTETLLLESLLELNRVLNSVENSLLRQISAFLQLLTPHALGCLSVIGGTEKIVISKGQDTILNVKSRPIRIYGNEGLRPIQAAEISLSSFGIPHVPSRMGGGQHEVFSNCLKLKYGDNDFWFTPVAPSRLIISLLEGT